MTSRSFALGLSIAALAIATAAWARNPWQGQPPYGKALMSLAERKTYWRELLALPNDEAKEAYWRAHIEKMQKRALERGVGIADPPVMRSGEPQKPRRAGIPYFQDAMTPEEQKAYAETLEAMDDPAERRAYIKDHVAKMRARALERGVSAPVPPHFGKDPEAEPARAESEVDAGAIEVEADDER